MKIPRKVCTEEELKCFGKDPMGFVLKLHEEFSDM